MPQDLTCDKSTLDQVIAMAIRQQAINLTNVDPELFHHVASLGHIELIQITYYLEKLCQKPIWLTSSLTCPGLSGNGICALMLQYKEI